MLEIQVSLPVTRDLGVGGSMMAERGRDDCLRRQTWHISRAGILMRTRAANRSLGCFFVELSLSLSAGARDVKALVGGCR
jgi:hypothetical protein